MLEAEKKVMEVGLTKFKKVEYWTPKVGNKKFWKLDRNVLKEHYGSFQGEMQENREFESWWSNIAKICSQNETNKFKTSNKKLIKWKWWSSRNLKIKPSKLDTRSSERVFKLKC